MNATIRNSVCIFVFCVWPMRAADGPGVDAFKISDQRLDGLWHIALVGSDSLRLDKLLRFYRDSIFVSRLKPRFVMIDGFANLEDYRRESSVTLVEKDYEDAVKAWRTLRAMGRFRMSQLIVSGEDSIFRSVDGNRVTRTVPFGSDPTTFSVNGRLCEVLEIHFLELPDWFHPDRKDSIVVRVQIKADKLPDAKTADSIAIRIQELTGQPRVELGIRTDTWFLMDGGPLQGYPFAPLAVPPSGPEYAAHGEVYCDEREGGIQCRRVWVPSR